MYVADLGETVKLPLGDGVVYSG